MSVEQDSSAQDSDRAQARITEVVENYIDFLTNGTAEQIADLYAPDATVEDPIGADVRNTREQLVEFYSIITNMDERTATLKWKKIAGDTAVFEFTLVTGTSGMRFEITPVDIMVFDADGKIARCERCGNPATSSSSESPSRVTLSPETGHNVTLIGGHRPVGRSTISAGWASAGVWMACTTAAATVSGLRN